MSGAPPAARSSAAAPVLLLAALVLAGCGGSEGDAGARASGTRGTASTSAAAGSSSTGDGAASPGSTSTTTASRPEPPASWTAACPTATPSPVYGCRASRGFVVSLESVDPDGDGDLHLILREKLPAGGVTLPGITVLDVRASLRPDRDPRPGDLVTGAGPVFRGHLRQKQIQVDVLRVQRR